MNGSTAPTYSRLKQMLKRQPDAGSCDPDYGAVTHATRGEAPRSSRPGTLYWRPYNRELHYMSIPERTAMTLALYNPAVFAIADQHRLHRYSAPHPLAGRRDTQGMVLPPFQGTALVADRLNMGSLHPRAYEYTLDAANKDGIPDAGETVEHLSCYVGDLLLFLFDESSGKPYAVNWTVKPVERAFHDPNYYLTTTRMQNEAGRRRNRELRHKLEEQYFLDAAIRTQRIIAEKIPPCVANNLRRLVGYVNDRHQLNPTQVAEMEDKLNALLKRGGTLLQEMKALTTQFKCTTEDCHAVFNQAIWFRRLRVSLHDPIPVDSPLLPEHTDVLRQYGAWFKE